FELAHEGTGLGDDGEIESARGEAANGFVALFGGRQGFHQADVDVEGDGAAIDEIGVELEQAADGLFAPEDIRGARGVFETAGRGGDEPAAGQEAFGEAFRFKDGTGLFCALVDGGYEVRDFIGKRT